MMLQDMHQKQSILSWYAVGVIAFSLFFLPSAALHAAGGVDCNNEGGWCEIEDTCDAIGDTENIGVYDCSELDTSSGDSSDMTHVCCKRLDGAASGGSQQQQPSTPPGYSNFRLQLPSCVSNGKCQLDDIVLTGVAFANLLMTLSGAFFFATFVYGGGMYVLSFGRADFVKKGTHAMTSAAIGMVIVLSAWTIVNYVASSLLGKI